MEQFLANHETRIAWWLFAAAFVLIGLAETFRPRKELGKSTARRWTGNALLAACDIAVESVFPLGGTLVAMMVAASPYGVLNIARVPLVLRCALAVILLDLLRYAQHRVFHGIPLLWRIHRVHHSDPDFDLTTGVRNHPGEVLLQQGIYLSAVALLAPPPLAVILLGVGTALQNLFSHANLRLPQWLEATLRPFLITPDVHRIHHSEQFAEQNSNFGFLFPWWDKLFRTYRAAPAEGHDKMRIGLRGFQDDRSMNVLHLLALPFRSSLGPANAVAEPETGDPPKVGAGREE